MQQMQQRPMGITLLSTLALLAAIGAAFQAFASVDPGSVGLFGHVQAGSGFGLAAAGFLIAAGIYLELAYGLWQTKGWAWILMLVLAIVHIAFNVGAAFLGGASWALAIGGSIVPLIILVYLATPGVRRAFGF